ISADKWDADRLAFMDVVIAMTALAEIVNFPKIPLAVSINEYIEIAKHYSTSKSGAFLNGILYSITNRMREEGKINK
ncbi:MAG: transcription antitermination factor NusB, partial [Muribaculaceae bacterium]|nr:transcription antitermination factor NusB [Muribaculaceae bacterium]